MKYLLYKNNELEYSVDIRLLIISQHAYNRHKDTQMSTDFSDDFQTIGYRLKLAQHALRLRMDRLLQERNLTMAQYIALSLIEVSPQITNAEIARRAFVTPQTMHRIIVDIESAGLVVASAASYNKRELLRSLTNRGTELVKYAHHVARKVEADMLRGLSAQDVEKFGGFLQTATNNLQEPV
jgi:DNA-binding MarR family transcriptional regulator